MAKGDIISRLKLESGEFDAKIKRAGQELLAYSEHCRKMGLEMGYANKDAKEFAKALGSMQTVSQTARGKINELSEAFVNWKVMYNNMTEAEKKGQFGKNLAASLDQLKVRLNAAKKDLADVQKELNGSGSMFGQLKNMAGSAAGIFGVSPAMLTGIGAATAAVSGLTSVFKNNITTATQFEKSMSILSSLTGKTGEDLDRLKEYAIELGSKTTLTASQVADAFRLIGSQQPQLLASSEALKDVTQNAITLAEAAGIDLQTAAQTLSTSINQMGGDSNNATRYVNVLAAASQKGAGDIAWLGEAITKSATAAKAVGTDYEELVANLEQLAKGGFDASTAGTALRSIIMNLEKQANNDFKPSIVGLTTAFENMGKTELTIVDYQQIAGKMFASQAKVLADNATAARDMTTAITGTNLALDQASTNTTNLDGSLKSLSSAWEGLNLHINSSNGFLKNTVDWLKSVVTWADQAFTSAGRAQKKLAEMQGGGNGTPTKVDRQIATLQGSNFKQQNFNAQVGRYNQDIKVAEYWLKRFDKDHSSVNTVLMEASKRFGQKMNSISDLQAVRDAMVRMRDEYSSRAQQILNPSNGTTNDVKTTVTLDEDNVIHGSNPTSTTKTSSVDKETEKTARMLVELRKAEAKATKEIADARAKEHQTETQGLSGFNEQTVSAWTSMMKDQLSKADFGSVVYNNIVENMRDMTAITELTKEALKRGLDPESLGLTEMYEQAFDNIDVPDQALQGVIDKINETFKDNPIKLDFETGKIDAKGDKKGNGKKDNDKKDPIKEFSSKAKQFVGGLNSVTSGLEGLGVEMPKEIGKLLGVLDSVSSIIQGVSTIISVFQVGAITANTVALNALTTSMWATGFWPFKNGGIVPAFANGGLIGKAAGGMVIPGNSFSGDNLRLPVKGGGVIGVNSGELILNMSQSQNVADALTNALQLADSINETYELMNRAQQGNLSSQLEGANNLSNLNMTATIRGEQIRLALNNNGRRTGRGEYVTSKRTK